MAMTVKQLKEELSKWNDDTKIVMWADAEGNGTHELESVNTEDGNVLLIPGDDYV